MDCAKATENIQAYIDDALSAAARRELEQHLQTCPECAEQLRMAQALHAAIRALPEQELPLDFSEKLHAALAAEPVPVKPGIWQRGWVKGLTAAACLLLVVGAVSLGSSIINRGYNDAPVVIQDGASRSESDMLYLAGADGGAPADPTPMAEPQMAALEEYGYDMDMSEREEEMGHVGLISQIRYNDESYDAQAPAAQLAELGEMAGGGEASPSSGGALEEKQLARKIIYNAQLSLEVDSVDAAYGQLQALAGRYGGYVVSSNTWSYEDDWSGGYVSIRVAAESLDAALAEIDEMGKVEGPSLDSRDVTMDYYDIQGRLEQYQLQESRLLDILTQAETVEDLILVESELTRVRAQLESLTGQIRYYDQMTALSSIDINLSELPPQTQSVQTSVWSNLGQGIRQGFIRGMNALAVATTNLIVWFFRVLPTLIVVLVVVLILVLIFRKRKPKRK